MTGTLVPENVLVCSVLLGIAMFAGYLTKKHSLVFLPESAIAIILGMVFGLVSVSLKLNIEFTFSGEVFFYGLLPIIIFNAGFSLRKKEFFRNFGTITLFAVFGTIVSALVYGLLTYYLHEIGFITHLESKSPLLESLMFGSLISAIDPVATLSIFQDVHAPSTLYNLVFGESLVNDASSIVLFRTFESFYETEFSLETIGVAIFSFCVISFGSLFLGIVVSFLCALTLRFIENHSEFSKFELAFVLLSAYMSYAVAEIMGLSGIMSLFFCGICNSHYAYYSMCHASKISSKYSFEALAFMAELFVFAYLGMQVVILDHVIDWGLLLSAIPLCLLSRAVNIFPLTWLANCFRKDKITVNMQIMMWLSGLRGAIAFALSVNMPSDNNAIESTTLFIIVFTTVFLGCTTSASLTCLGLIPESPGSHKSPLDVPLIATEAAGLVSDKKEGLHKWFTEYDSRYLKPVFGGRREPKLDESVDDVLVEDFAEAYVNYLGSGFSLSVPEEWTESFHVVVREGVLVRFLCPLDGQLAAAEVTVSRQVLPGVEGVHRDLDAMAFLSRHWEDLDFEGVRSNDAHEATLAELGDPKRAPVARLGLANFPVSRKGSLSPVAFGRTLENGEGESAAWSGRTLPRLGSLSELKATDPAGMAFDSRMFPGSKSVRDDSGPPSPTLSFRKASLSSLLPREFLESLEREELARVLVPAFVMWTEMAEDPFGKLYLRYEIVIHPDVEKSEVSHLLVSVSGHNGALFVCRVKATEAWWYQGGFRVAKAILDSFRVGANQPV